MIILVSGYFYGSVLSLDVYLTVAHEDGDQAYPGSSNATGHLKKDKMM